MLEFRDTTFGYGRRAILEHVSIDIQGGDLLGLVGPNGAGKTTLLRGLLGQLKPRSGEVRWANGHPPRIGFVPQRENLNPVWPLRVLDVVLMGRCVLRGPFRRFRSEDHAEAKQAMDAVGILALAERPIANLSGGQIQRTLLARALASHPDLLVLDEPISGLDLAGSAGMLRLIRNLHRERKLTVLFVSHDLNAVAAIATRLILLHEGKVREDTASEILSPKVLGVVYGLDVVVGEIASQRHVSVVLPRDEASVRVE